MFMMTVLVLEIMKMGLILGHQCPAKDQGAGILRDENC